MTITTESKESSLMESLMESEEMTKILDELAPAVAQLFSEVGPEAFDDLSKFRAFLRDTAQWALECDADTPLGEPNLI